MNKFLVNLAFNMGKEAFNNNINNPARDKAFLELCVKGNKVGESIPYLKAWNEGWNYENLKREVI